MLTDTIAAISTAIGAGGISIIRISGEDAFDIIKKIFIYKGKNEFEINHSGIKYGNIIDPSTNEIVDEVLISFFIAPKSFTTENVVEINCHGGLIVTNRILEIVILNGARIALAGEFTKRAFLGGRIDLVQAEAIIEMINSNSKKMAAESAKQLDGKLSVRIKEIKDIIVNITANIEVSNDYPEYEFEELDREYVKQKLKSAIEKIGVLCNTFEEGKIIREGIKVAIVGRPNAGKSSLLNAILMEDRAIVTDIEGTTRDVIEERISIDNINVILKDTAGIRETSDKIEIIGIDRSREVIKDSDVVICIIAANKEISKDDIEIIKSVKEKKCIYIINKIDLVDNSDIINLENNMKNITKNENNTIIRASIINNTGIEELKESIRKMFSLGEISNDNKEIITNLRHKNLIGRCGISMNNALESLEKDMPQDMLCIDLRDGLSCINEITGENVSEDVIREIFSKFCVGK